MENGSITLIASTTENPFFYVYNALLSRSTVFEFKQVEPREMLPAVERALGILKERSPLPLAWEEGVPMLLATQCGGDVRKAINACELLYEAAETKDGELLLTSEDALQVAQRSAMRYDKGGDAMYDMASALMKSLRGSAPDAALYYAFRLIDSGCDPMLIFRRLMAHAAEDVGLANTNALVVSVSACLAYERMGAPEGLIPLTEAIICVCTSPKSNSVVVARDAALACVRKSGDSFVPYQLRNYTEHSPNWDGKKYVYPHDYGGYYKQQYLPDGIKDEVFYVPKNEGDEPRIREFMERVRKLEEENAKKKNG